MIVRGDRKAKRAAILELVDSDSARLEEAFVTLVKAPDFDARAEKGSAQHFQVAVVAVIESRREFFPELFQACANLGHAERFLDAFDVAVISYRDPPDGFSRDCALAVQQAAIECDERWRGRLVEFLQDGYWEHAWDRFPDLPVSPPTSDGERRGP